MNKQRTIIFFLIFGILLSACNLNVTAIKPTQTPASYSGLQEAPASGVSTPLPVRPAYKPGELVDYTAQSGDTLIALASHFNTSVAEIMAANPIIPADATTMPAGFPMRIPIYYKSLWANPYKILPDAAFVNGPMQTGFNTSAFVASQPGWLKDYQAFAGSGPKLTGAEIVDYVSTNWSVSPRLLLALLEYRTGALSQSTPPSDPYMLGYQQSFYKGLYLQLVLAANTLNNGYYGWRAGKLSEFYLSDGTIIRPDPWQNAASVGIQFFFSRFQNRSDYERSTGPTGLSQTYTNLFGDPWATAIDLIPGSLKQPVFRLPFQANQIWTFTGGPHTAWGVGDPFAAVDFAPPSEHHGCFVADPQNFVVAVASGLVVRSGPDGIAIDLDGDGNERTGWVVFYLHLAADTRVPLGKQVQAGDFVGYPSCQGGEATGTHVHIARKYNGEWILADGPLAFNFEGWISHSSGSAYRGSLTRGGATVISSDTSDAYSQISSGINP
jgi:murein DD-endopeptidase MepM/ murein hydrolase activator NlpD